MNLPLLLLIYGVYTAIFFSDLKHRIIPNWCNIALATIALLSLVGMSFELSVLFIVFALFWVITFLAIAQISKKIVGRVSIGGGDIKMIGPLAVIHGPLNISIVVCVSCVLGFAWIAQSTIVTKSAIRDARVPFGSCLSLVSGTMLTFELSKTISENWSIFAVQAIIPSP